ncbi:DNA-binding domain-containing protein, AraC-type [Desulfosporosinus orientis DSM 765]|uniref:DNA-binding domain-containing protein, AraC-type n=1 Tax=Desulfosporosinus orientis (strain ATCC 19365 / DSM 765 / NCIMB 8382 / VKM B-1628 / Singapore I) TaxID=768706 RepID=G7WGN4_DESOD|nr:AraC family transcriptional regulator [Desulfosporosinus orientis]AET68470.1 DNA-binding domain-containing protein, AraC-type [Desulfosporosinus orientis DSM 765]
MHAWEAIQKSVDYIETHTTEEISIETLAGIAGLSPYYFQRLFKRLVKKTVFEYVRLRRLAQSAQALKDNKRIADVAAEYGFSSHANFTRAFKEAYNITPEEYRRKSIPLNQVNKPDLQLNYILVDENVPLITDGIVIEITRRKLDKPETYHGLTAQISISNQIPVGETTGIDTPFILWERFHKMKPEIKGLSPNGVEIGASMMGNMKNGTFTYFAGASAIGETPVSDPLTAWVLPAAEYIVCSLETENFTELITAALDKAMKYLFGTWLPKHKLTTQPFSAEKYYRPTSDGAYMEIWVIPVPIESEQISN